MKRILVAEDDADIRELIRFKLVQAGFAVTAVGDGSSVLERARADPPDLLMLDVMLPGMRGTEVCAALRGEAATADLPIMLLTARAQESEIEQGMASGADAYVVKPFSPRDLVDRVTGLLDRPARARP
jgi:DNA-binding response OmpR family regulator